MGNPTEFSGDIDTVGKCANCGVEYHIHKPDAGEQPLPKDVLLALEIARLEIESLNARCGYINSGALMEIAKIQTREEAKNG